MSEVVNLNKARKVRSRAADQAKASENRAKFGRNKAEKTADKLARERNARILDNARREP